MKASGNRVTSTPQSQNRALRSTHKAFATLRRRLQSACNVIRATLSEIFDESAYNRFLLRTETSRSVASYRDFMQERDAAMTKKPRCC